MSLLFTQDQPSLHLEETPAEYAAKMPDVVVHDTAKNRLFLIEAVTNAGPIDGTRLKELKELFADCTAGSVFVTAFLNRQGFLKCLEEVAWETEVWVADIPDHLIHGPNLWK